jgi:predicted acetyltransferase
VSIEIRTVPANDLRRWVDSVAVANSEEIDDQVWSDVRPTVEADRTFGAYDGEDIVGGGSIYSFDVTVPGGEAVPSAGITWVGIMPTHRRQGALRQLMSRMFDDARRRAEPLAVLWASEGSIYQRFGYGLSTLASSVDLERERAIFNSAAEPFGATHVISIDDAREAFTPIFESNRARIPGFYSRSQIWWDVEVLADFKWSRRGFDKRFFALHETDGHADAYAMYRVRHDWVNSVPGSELQVGEIMALDGDALREMWRFIFGIDLIKRYTTRSGPIDEPLLLMVAEPRRVNLRLRDGMWLRILDVPEALQRRGYSADGTIVLDIADNFLPDVGGRFRVTTSGGRGQVERTDDAPDLEVDASDLAAVYLGGFTFEGLARAGRTNEIAPGARARADAMFYSAAPAWCPQTF